VINSLLLHYAGRCKKSDIDFSCKIAIPDQLNIPDYDICILVGNLLENAVDASQKLDSNRKIILEIKEHNDQLMLKITNNFKKEIEVIKNINRGLGLRSVQLVTQRYGGELFIEKYSPSLDNQVSDDGINVFSACVMIVNKKPG